MSLEDSILDFDPEESAYYKKYPASVLGVQWYFGLMVAYYFVLYSVLFIQESGASPNMRSLLYILGMAFALYTIKARYRTAWFLTFGVLTYQLSLIFNVIIYNTFISNGNLIDLITFASLPYWIPFLASIIFAPFFLLKVNTAEVINAFLVRPYQAKVMRWSMAAVLVFLIGPMIFV